jgi:SAM-dependent methyltransferase
MYSDLAEWWPVLSPPEEYAEEAPIMAGLLRTGGAPVRTLLELGCGGGHLASHLPEHLPDVSMTLVDLSEQMLAVSRALNPHAEHVAADMRTLRLNRRFDAVLVHDAIDYLLDPAELDALAATVAAHLAPGGVAVLAPDHVVEAFHPATLWGGSDAPDGRAARYLEWTHDPDPGDTWAQADYAFVLREAGGTVRYEGETHRFGLFDVQTWLDVLDRAGLTAAAVAEQPDDDRQPRTLFVARRPPG